MKNEQIKERKVEKTKGAINNKELLRHMIEDTVSADDGLYLALKEIINNSLDAGASKIKIKFGKYDGADALIISDDGAGFTQKAINSMLSFAFSAQKRNDIKTIGTNGTGSKMLLGLGDLDKTKITVLSVCKDFTSCKRLDIDFDYLYNLGRKKAKAEDQEHDITTPENWNEDMPRTTGATVILTGYDGRRVRGATQLIKNLGEHITPKSSKYVTIQDGKKWQGIEPVVYRGSLFEMSFDEYSTLGKVEFVLYYGRTNASELAMCGTLNMVSYFSDFVKKLDATERKKLSYAWKNISGHIYIEKANMYRVHNGGLNKQFYAKPAKDLLKILHLVGEELSTLNEAVYNKELFEKRQRLVDRIIEANRKLSATGLGSGTTAPSPGASPAVKRVKPANEIKEGPDFTPTLLRLSPRQTKEIILRNRGLQFADFGDVKWRTESNLFKIEHQSSENVKIVTGENTGSAILIAEGSFGSHSIKVDISTLPIGAYISGPNALKPGGTCEYDLFRYEGTNLQWEIRGAEGIILQESDKKKIKITIPDNCTETHVILAVRVVGDNEDLATKKIEITPEENKNTPVVVINKKEYRLEVNLYFQDTVAQLDSIDWEKDENQLPKIVINPLAPRLKMLGFMNALDSYLAAIALAALSKQVEDGEITAFAAAALAEEFISTMKVQLLSKDEKEVTEE